MLAIVEKIPLERYHSGKGVTNLHVTVTEHPAADISEALVECHNIARRGIRVSEGRSSHRRILNTSESLALPSISDHVVRELLPQDDPLSLAVIPNVLASTQFAGAAVWQRAHAESLRVDRHAGKSLLATIFIEVDILGHGHNLVAI